MFFWKHPRARFYRRALGYFKPDLPRVCGLLSLIGLSTLLGLLQVWPMAILVDTVLTATPQHSWFHRLLPAGLGENVPAQVALLAAAMLLMRLAQEVLNMFRGMLNLTITNNGLMRIRCDLFRKFQALHMLYHKSQKQGDVIYRLTSDTTGCQMILSVLIEVGVAAATLMVMLSIMLSRSLELTLVALAVIPPLVAINILYGKTLKAQSLDAKEIESQFTSTIQRSIASIGLMQAFGRERMEFGRFRSTAKESLSAWYTFHRRFACYRIWVGLIFGGGAAAIFGYGGYLVHRDQFVAPVDGGMTVGSLMVFLTYLGMLYDPLCKITGAGANVLGGVVGTERVFEILDREPLVTDAPDAVNLPCRPRTLSLSNAGFAYTSGQPVLREVDVTIEPGEMVAFVGSSGVGKTTLLNLLPRFMDPTEGALELDGHDARRVRLKDLRRHIALVLQESIILPTTVRENIAYGRRDAHEAEIRRAAELAGADAFIRSLPEGYDTEVAEGGQNLSGGQRQRIAIARALLTEAPIIVLDEPTSALDPQHERLITDTLGSLKGRRTLILVSHRLSTVVECDRIYVMDGGRIVEQGTHRELLARRGLYYRMARHQLQLDEPETIDGPRLQAGAAA